MAGISANELQNRNYGNSAYGSSVQEIIGSELYGLTQEDIYKALATTGTVGTDASSMIGESLDPVVKQLTLNSQNFAPKIKRFNTYEAMAIAEEYVRITKLGLAEGSFRGEGALGVQDSSTYQRVTQNVRYLGQVGAVTNAMLRASKKKFGDLKALEATLRLDKMLQDLDRDIWWGDSTLNSLSFQGLRQQMSSSSTYNIDLATTDIAGTRTTITAGGTFTQAVARAQAEKFLLTGGTPTALYVSPVDKNTLSADQDTNIRWYLKDQSSSVASGMVVDQLNTDFGNVDLIWDTWLRGFRGKQLPTPNDPTGTFHDESPAIPGVAPAGAVAADGYLPVDVYYYGVSFVNEVSEGPIKLQSTGYTTTNANGKVNLTVTMPGSVDDIKSIRVYRSTTNGTDYTKMRLISETARSAVAGATQVIADDGSMIPGSRESVMLNERLTGIGMLEYPVMWDLPRTDNSWRFAIDCMAVCQLYNTENMIRWHNLGGSVTDPA